MGKKSAKMIDSNQRNFTKPLNVPKRECMCSKCEFASKQWNVQKHGMCSKCVLASKKGNVPKWNKELSKIECYSFIKV